MYWYISFIDFNLLLKEEWSSFINGSKCELVKRGGGKTIELQ